MLLNLFNSFIETAAVINKLHQLFLNQEMIIESIIIDNRISALESDRSDFISDICTLFEIKFKAF